MARVRLLTDDLYNDKDKLDTESLACTLTGLFTVAGDAYGDKDVETGDLYRARFNKIYDLVMARPDADDVLGKDGKDALEMVKGLISLFDLLEDSGDDSTGDELFDLEYEDDTDSVYVN